MGCDKAREIAPYEETKSKGLGGRFAETCGRWLDTLAILKMGTATTGTALDKREKTKQTKFLVTKSVSCSLVLVSGR